MYTAVFDTSISSPGLWLLLSNGEEKLEKCSQLFTK